MKEQRGSSSGDIKSIIGKKILPTITTNTTGMSGNVGTTATPTSHLGHGGLLHVVRPVLKLPFARWGGRRGGHARRGVGWAQGQGVNLQRHVNVLELSNIGSKRKFIIGFSLRYHTLLRGPKHLLHAFLTPLPLQRLIGGKTLCSWA